MNALNRIRFQSHALIQSHQGRVARSRLVVEQALSKCRSPYIGFSAGKDSACVLHLVREFKSDIPAVYFDADNAYPETTQLLDEMEQKGLRLIRWKCRPFLEILKEFGLHSDAVEDATMRYTVHEPAAAVVRSFGFDAVFLGLRRQESPGRSKLLSSRGRAFVRKSDGVLECNPIADWSYNDVWAYILSNNIPYCRAYDKLFEMELPEKSIRLSYWAGESGRRWGRYEALRRGWPDLWQKLCDAVPEARSYG